AQGAIDGTVQLLPLISRFVPLWPSRMRVPIAWFGGIRAIHEHIPAWREKPHTDVDLIVMQRARYHVPMRIKTLVFDFGNVIGLFDHRIVVERLSRLADLPQETIRRHLLNEELEVAYESGKLSTAELLRYARRTCGFRCSDDELILAIADMFRR